jgi:glycosyltransferase involved in cell wall biosynthesis
MGKMRVAIDATPLLVRSAGVKNHLYHWIAALRRAAGSEAIATFPAMDRLGPLNHNRSVTGRGRTVCGLAALGLTNRLPFPVLDWLTRADVFHVSNLLRRPPHRPRVTATIYDMTCRLMPEMHAAANVRADRELEEVFRRADGLIAISESTKRDAVRLLGIAEEKIAVIHCGVAESFFAADGGGVEAVRARYGLKRPFALFVGTIEPRKNLDSLMDAWEALPAGVRAEFELVIAGPGGWAPPGTMARVRSFRYLGYVPEPELAALTAAAAVFVYPSLYEGFGLPVAQAMAAGVAVVTSNVSSLPEIAGDAALLVDPRSTAEVRDAICRLLLSADMRARLAERGRTRAEAFRWEECAAKSLRFFEKIAG